MIDIAYQGGGLFLTQEEWRHPWRTIDTYEIIYGMAGCICIEEDGVQFELRAGDALLLLPGRRHGGWRQSQGETSFYWVHFSLPGERGLREAAGLPAGKLELANGNAAAPYFRQLIHAAYTPRYPDYAVKGALLMLIGELAYQLSGTGVPHRIVAEAAEWIRINSARKITAAQTAARFGYHTDYLSALFRRTYGLSLGKYISEQRLRQAKSLLLTTEATIQQIASALRFDNANQFNHFFRHHEGVSPTQYRRQYPGLHWNDR